jgi:hypothetical protein
MRFRCALTLSRDDLECEALPAEFLVRAILLRDVLIWGDFARSALVLCGLVLEVMMNLSGYM